MASRFHGEIVDRLVDGAVRIFRTAGVAAADLVVVRVPGAWEIPQGLGIVLRGGRWDGLVALGALIRGETLHFDLIAREAARGVAELSSRSGVPIAFGILTCETMDQALARAGGAVGHQGEEAAEAALEMAALTALPEPARPVRAGSAGPASRRGRS